MLAQVPGGAELHHDAVGAQGVLDLGRVHQGATRGDGALEQQRVGGAELSLPLQIGLPGLVALRAAIANRETILISVIATIASVP